MLDAFATPGAWTQRLAADPIELPRRFSEPRDVEVVGLVATCLAYGRADLFKPKVASIVDALGPSPARAVADLDVRGAKALLEGFVYRFNVAADLATLLLGIGRTLERHGSLEEAFLRAEEDEARYRAKLEEAQRLKSERTSAGEVDADLAAAAAPPPVEAAPAPAPVSEEDQAAVQADAMRALVEEWERIREETARKIIHD